MVLRFKEGLVPKYTKKEYKIVKEKERIEPIAEEAYQSMNEIVYKLLEQNPVKYKYEQILFFEESISGYKITGPSIIQLFKYLDILSKNELPDSECAKILYNNEIYKIPISEAFKIKDICEKLDKLFAETDYKIDELAQSTPDDNTNNKAANLYEERHSI
ncbi:MAG: hypothetical protein ACRC57_00370 [Sarcina sp.]